MGKIRPIVPNAGGVLEPSDVVGREAEIARYWNYCPPFNDNGSILKFCRIRIKLTLSAEALYCFLFNVSNLEVALI